uniref:Uncharacterized protein n=1 Tax=Cacopsylla melanoneura TaxID=428564 RepID=A0A8D9FC70_9HEMI
MPQKDFLSLSRSGQHKRRKSLQAPNACLESESSIQRETVCSEAGSTPPNDNNLLIDPPIDPSATNNVPFQLEELNSHECPSLFETYEYSSESDSDNDSDIVKQKLANWAVEHQIQNKALSALLVILNVHNFFSNFPRMLEHY